MVKEGEDQQTQRGTQLRPGETPSVEMLQKGLFTVRENLEKKIAELKEAQIALEETQTALRVNHREIALAHAKIDRLETELAELRQAAARAAEAEKVPVLSAAEILQQGTAALIEAIREGKEIPLEFRQVLKDLGWSNPEESNRLTQHARSTQEAAATSAREAAELRSKHKEVVHTNTELKDKVNDLQEKLATANITLSELKQQIEALKQQVAASQISEQEKKPVASDSNFAAATAAPAAEESVAELEAAQVPADLKALKADQEQSTEVVTETAETNAVMIKQFRAFCDELLAAPSERLQGKGERKRSDQSKIEALSTFLERDQSEFNPRFGLYRLIEYLYGSAVSLMGNPYRLGEALFGEATPQRTKEIGDIIEALTKDNRAKELLKDLVEGLVGCRKYYDYGNQTDIFFLNDLAEISPTENWKKDKFFVNVPNILEVIGKMTVVLQKMESEQKNSLVAELAHDFDKVEKSSLVTELREIVQKYPNVFTADYEADLQAVDIDGEKAADVLIGIFQRNKANCSLLKTVCQKLAPLLPLAAFHQDMMQRIDIETPRVNNGGEILEMQDGVNPYRVLLSAVTGGANLGEQNSDWYRHFRLSTSTNWPPRVSYRNGLDQALKNERPVSLSLNRQKKIMLLTGNNGGGKTSAMENFAQTLGEGLTLGTNSTARIVRLSEVSEIRSLVGASRHTDKLSSFQREVALLGDVLETLSNRPPGTEGVLIVDEVGKGTDSRDAIALMISVAEYCRRHNIYLLMATHHGKDFVSLAKKLGLRDEMTILSPDFETHQLKEFDEPETSKGVEVMRERARRQKMPDKVADALCENARRVRESVLMDSVPTLSPVELAEKVTSEAFTFADEETLNDIGLGRKAKSYYDKGAVAATMPLREMGAEVAGMSSRRGVWDGSFSRKWDRLLNSNEADLATEHTLLRALVECVGQLPGGDMTEFMKNSGEALTTAASLLGGASSSEGLAKMTAQYERFLQADLAKGLYLGDTERRIMDDFTNKFGNQAQRAKAFESVTALSNILLTSDNPKVVNMGKRIARFAQMQEKLDQVVTGAEAQGQEQFKLYMYKKVAEALRSCSSPRSYSSYKLTDADVTELASILREPVTPKTEFFEAVAAKIEQGDQQVYSLVAKWLIDGREKATSIYSYSSSGKGSVYSSAKLGHLVGAAETLQARHEAVAKAGLPASIKAAGNFKEMTIKAFLEGDNSVLFTLMQAARKAEVYFDSYAGGDIATIVKGLDTNKFLAWQGFLGQKGPEVSQDLYAVLGVPEDADRGTIRSAKIKIAGENHTDRIIPQELQGKDEADMPVDIREKVEQARARFDSVMKAGEVLEDAEKRALYDQDRDAQAVLDMGYYATMVNAIRTLNWCQPTYSTDGSLDIRGSLAVNLLGKMDQSEIVRQSFSFDAVTESVVIGGSNGNGKSQLLVQLAAGLEWAKLTGYLPAESAVLPKVNFIGCMVNSGESTEGKSSFQNEIDKYLDLIKRYMEAGSPRDGIIFLDEPLAGTSSEDQIGILLAMIEFFRQRNVKFVFTNHNYRAYEFMRRMVCSDGTNINFKPVAFLAGKGKEKFTLSEFDVNGTDQIRSNGIAVAGEFEFPPELVQIALFARKVLTGSTGVAT